MPFLCVMYSVWIWLRMTSHDHNARIASSSMFTDHGAELHYLEVCQLQPTLSRETG
jgi:hypothetical protein